MKIGIIRHGSTAWNKERRAQGSSDIPLDEAGLSEARKLAERLQNEDWDIIYTSPLQRAKKTAEIVKDSLNGVDLHIDERLREVSGGLIEGTTEEERLEKWGTNWRELDLGFEPSEEVFARAKSIISEIVESYPNKNILIVSHGSFIRHLLRLYAPNQDLTISPMNTSITVLSDVGTSWNCELYNCTKHL